MFWLGSVNGTAGLPFFTQIRFRLKHRCWGKLSRTTRSRRREQPFSLFLSFHTLPNLVQKRVQSGAQQSSCTLPSSHPPVSLFIPPSHLYMLSLSVLWLFQGRSCVLGSAGKVSDLFWVSLSPLRAFGSWVSRAEDKLTQVCSPDSSASTFPFYERDQLNRTRRPPWIPIC